MKVVLDTNTLASSAIASKGTMRLIVDTWFAKGFEVIVSSDIVAELERTLVNPYFTRKLSANDRQQFLDDVRRRARFVTPTVTVAGVATHPDDDLVLAAAVSAAADYLVTGDKHLRQVANYSGVAILSPREFADRL